MDSAPDNPQSNKLPAGIKEQELLETISKSGYPLQTIVGRQLGKQGFEVYEEWSYIDKETNKERNIDIMAKKVLCDFDEKRPPKVTPWLDILVECKKSEMPYVFFLMDSDEFFDIVSCSGLVKDTIAIESNGMIGDEQTDEVLGLDKLDFTGGKINRCMTFTKCVRESKLVIRGDESYNEIVMPMIKAAEQFKIRAKPPKSAKYFDCHFLACVAVVDAPMVGVKVMDDSNVMTLMPWVRLTRYLTSSNDIWYGESKELPIDIVHKDYFQTYINNHLQPFANEFSKRVMRHQKELASCKGRIKNLDGDFESQLAPI